MPSISKNLNLSNLTQKNYNSMELFLWDISDIPGAILSGMTLIQNGTSVTVRWGDRTQNNTTQKTLTINHTY